MQPHEILIIQKIDKLQEQLDRIEKNQEKLEEKLSKVSKEFKLLGHYPKAIQ